MRIILLNGPPGSGKDLATRFLVEHLASTKQDWKVLRMSHPIKRAFAGLMDAEIDEWGSVGDGWEEQKDLKSELLNKTTYRQWQINFSEKFMKPLYGNDIFGRIFCQTIEHLRDSPALGEWNGYVIVPDCGFPIEATTLGHLLPEVRKMLVHIHRPGHSFKGDSRSYVWPVEIPLITRLDNDSTTEVWKDRALSLLLEHNWNGFAG